jgi:hypothetical protein
MNSDCITIIITYLNYAEYSDSKIRQFVPFAIYSWRKASHIVRNGSQSTHVNGKFHSLDDWPSFRYSDKSNQTWLWHSNGNVYKTITWHISGYTLSHPPKYNRQAIRLTDLHISEFIADPLDAIIYTFHGTITSGWLPYYGKMWYKKASYALIISNKSRIFAIKKDPYATPPNRVMSIYYADESGNIFNSYTLPDQYLIFLPRFYITCAYERAKTMGLLKN